MIDNILTAFSIGQQVIKTLVLLCYKIRHMFCKN
jgi:hypothetical protein